MNFKFYIERIPWGGDGYDIYLRWKENEGTMGRAMPIVLITDKPENEGTRAEPMMRLHDDHAKDTLQSLMDELWNIGIRPKDIGTAGHLAATQSHLNDFRAITSKLLNVQLP
jgi:hypothetical protein